MTATHKAKQVLRKQIRSSLSKMTAQELTTQSSQVFDNLFELPEYETLRSVGLFLSMPKGEIHTDDACNRILQDGKSLFVPRCGLDFEQCDMDLIQVPLEDVEKAQNSKTFYEDWPKNKWGIPEPPVDSKYHIAQPGDIDLLIVPGLGFDSKGGRLGQGKGYYDRFIQKMRDGVENVEGNPKKPVLVAVGLNPSFVSEGIPMAEHDFRMQKVCLPSQILNCENN